MRTHRRSVLAILMALLLGFTAGWLSAGARRVSDFPRHRPTPGPTVSAPWTARDRLPLLFEGGILPQTGRWFETGNIRFPVVPAVPVVKAVVGTVQETEDGLILAACGRRVAVRWAERGARPQIAVTGPPGARPPRPRWPMRAGEFSFPRPLDPLAGIWLYGGEALASQEWLREVMGVRVDWHHQKGMRIWGCSEAAQPFVQSVQRRASPFTWPFRT